jgi:hypothetical protein
MSYANHMQLDESNATIVLDTRRAITSGEYEGKYSVKLRVTFQVVKEVERVDCRSIIPLVY